MKSKIWLSSPHMGGNEMKYVSEAYNTNWIAPLGPNVNNFEEDICKFSASKSAAALSSGTAAIHLALVILGVKKGDDVLCSTFTFSASANPITYVGANPIFIDSEKSTWNMDPLLLEKAIVDRISNYKKPKAIIVAHLYGMPAKMQEIMNISNKYDIPVIEDAAEALGSKLSDKQMGTWGNIGIFSFNGNKIITTSGGGALVSDNIEFVNKARFLSTQSRDNAPHYEHTQIGFNYRMSNILAGIGRGQMEVLSERIIQRRANHDYYMKHLDDISGITVFTEPNDDFFSNHWLSCILVDSSKTKNELTREDIRLAMLDENIETRPLWKPMHMQPVFADCKVYENGISERLFEIGLCLPSGSNMTDIERERVIKVLLKILK
ncbi:MAG: aminotransferase class I/II-fold pyridoxal phosphate-dependent enzyme [Marinifilaceae bacterium]|jgi:dTDP-4-amino-4,6-dideoxygalactose transaminase|nr:aminotransferase class I/II-fold pyridoxal phosphate-dependent enzyme [Marinifilaceae bacterium]